MLMGMRLCMISVSMLRYGAVVPKIDAFKESSFHALVWKGDVFRYITIVHSGTPIKVITLCAT